MIRKVDVLIIGAGAAGLMCAIEAGKRHRNVTVLDHANKAGKKILMSGGGRCNFTNYHAHPDNFISHNPHFCKSALSRYTQWDFIELVKKHRIPFHEKTLGQLFCDHKSKDIVDMLLAECAAVNATIQLDTSILSIKKLNDNLFHVKTNRGDFQCYSLVIASGGLSIPTMGASPFGYKVAEQFELPVWPTRAGLVPLTLHVQDKEKLAELSGVSLSAIVGNHQISFKEDILFTHRGLSGPAILQISSYWLPGENITINLLPALNANEYLHEAKINHPYKQLNTILSEMLPKRVVDIILPKELAEKKINAMSNKEIELIANQLNAWHILPNGTEGYRTAEVTLGGVDCNHVSSKTMEAMSVKGLYFIGEVLDMSGWLGGYNFQWAWSSGWAAGQVV